MEVEIQHFTSLDTLSAAGARFIIGYAQETVDQKGQFTWALSGGKTPLKLYQKLADPLARRRVPWDHIHVFWGDERCVPPRHQLSNYNMANTYLISKVPIPATNIHRILGEKAHPEEAAATYEKALQGFFSLQENTFPEFDLILLGLGSDGHTASLFPGDAALDEKRRRALPVRPPAIGPQVHRVTLTLPVINAARCVLFLVSGTGKHAILRSILASSPDNSSHRYPAAKVEPRNKLIWLIHQPERRSKPDLKNTEIKRQKKNSQTALPYARNKDGTGRHRLSADKPEKKAATGTSDAAGQ